MICPKCSTYPWIHTQLLPGQRIAIYLKTEQGVVSDGYATLIEQVTSWRIPEPYPVVLNCKKCRKQTNVLDQRWLVKYDDGFTTTRWLAVLTKQGTIHVEDEYDQISDDEPEELLE